MESLIFFLSSVGAELTCKVVVDANASCFMFHASCFMSPGRVASFDGLPDVNRAPYKLTLTSCKALKNGVVWLRYKKG